MIRWVCININNVTRKIGNRHDTWCPRGHLNLQHFCWNFTDNHLHMKIMRGWFRHRERIRNLISKHIAKKQKTRNEQQCVEKSFFRTHDHPCVLSSVWRYFHTAEATRKKFLPSIFSTSLLTPDTARWAVSADASLTVFSPCAKKLQAICIVFLPVLTGQMPY